MKNNFSRKLLSLILSAALMLNSGATAFAADGSADGADGAPIVTASETATTPDETPPADETKTEAPPADETKTEAPPADETKTVAAPAEGAATDNGKQDAEKPACTCNPAPGTSGVEGHGKDCPQYTPPEKPTQSDCTCPTVDSGKVVHGKGCPLYIAPATTAEDVLALINALPTMDELGAVDTKGVGFAEYLAKLRLDTAAARAAYNALTTEEKAAFDATALAKLTALEVALAAFPVLMTGENAITIKVNNVVTEYSGATLEAAILATGLTANAIKKLTITAGAVTAEDWAWFVGDSANNYKLHYLEHFTVENTVTSVAEIVNITDKSTFPTRIVTVSIPIVKEIGKSAFNGCDKLISASFPAVKSIGAKAFVSCDKLLTLGLPATPPKVPDGDVFADNISKQLEYLNADGTHLADTAAAKAAYKAVNDGNTADNLWHGWLIDDTVTDAITIGYSTDGTDYTTVSALNLKTAFDDVTLGEVTHLKITAGDLTAQDWNWFADKESGDKATPLLTALTHFTVDNAVNSVADISGGSYEKSAFPQTIVSVTIPKAKTLGSYAFYNCKKLETVDLPDVTLVGNNVFKLTDGATIHIKLHKATEFGQDLFKPGEIMNPKFTNVTLEAPMATTLDKSAFAGISYNSVLKFGAVPPMVTGGTALTFKPTITLTQVKLVDGNCVLLEGEELKAAQVAYRNADGKSTNRWYGLRIDREIPIGLVFNYSTEKNAGSHQIEVFRDLFYFVESDRIPQITELELQQATITAEDWTWFFEEGGPASQLTALTDFTISKKYVNINNVADIPDGTADKGLFPKTLVRAGLPVSDIGDYAFGGCDKLATLVLCATPPTVAANTFAGCPDDRALELVTDISNPLIGNELKAAMVLYKAARDGNTTDNLWYGWKIQKTDPSVSLANGRLLENAIEVIGDPTAIKTLTITAGKVTTADWTYLKNKLTSLTDFTIKAAVTSVADIPDLTTGSTFPTSIVNVTIPQALKIGDCAFNGCTALETLNIPAATSIGSNAFNGCTALKTLKLGATPPTTVGVDAFNGVPRPRSLTLVAANGTTPLAGGELTTALAAYTAFDDGNTTDNFWYGWKISPLISDPIIISVSNGTDTKAIGGEYLQEAVEFSAMATSTIKTLTITAGKVTTADWTYLKNKLTSLTDFTIKAAVTSVADIPDLTTGSTFPTSIVNVTIPQALKIGDCAFNGCTALETLNIPAATSIGSNAFNGCTALETLKLGATPPTAVGVDAFNGVPRPRGLTLVAADGTTPLAGGELTTALAAYTAITDGDTTDNLWYNWKIDPTKSDPDYPNEAYNTLNLGDTYYFDLSAYNNLILGQETDDLTYTRFIYAGTIGAYSLTNADDTNTASTPRSLFAATSTIRKAVPWDTLNSQDLVFGAEFPAQGVSYKLRLPSGGTKQDGTTKKITPANNEIDRIFENSPAYMPPNSSMANNSMWVQDKDAADPTRKVIRRPNNSNISFDKLDSVMPNVSTGEANWRPMLEIGGSVTDNFGTVTLNMNGGNLNVSTTSMKLVYQGVSYTAPPSARGFKAPSSDKAFAGWNTQADGAGVTYKSGDSVPSTVATLYALWLAPEAEWTVTGESTAAKGTLADGFAALATKGGSIKLLTNVTFGSEITVPATKIALNLGNYNLTRTPNGVWDTSSLFVNNVASDFTIGGTGTVTGTVRAGLGKLTINSGNFKGDAALWISNECTVVLNGGSYEATKDTVNSAIVAVPGNGRPDTPEALLGSFLGAGVVYNPASFIDVDTGYGANSNGTAKTVVVEPDTKAPIPQNVKAGGNRAKPTITWEAVAGTGATYDVYQYTITDGTWAASGTKLTASPVSGASYTLTTAISAAGSYGFAVVAHITDSAKPNPSTEGRSGAHLYATSVTAPGGIVDTTPTQEELDVVFGEGGATLDGNKIIIDADITFTGSVTINATPTTIDLNGHDITGGAGKTPIVVGGGVTVEIIGEGTISGGNATTGAGGNGITVGNGSNITIGKDVTVSGGNGAGASSGGHGINGGNSSTHVDVDGMVQGGSGGTGGSAGGGGGIGVYTLGTVEVGNGGSVTGGNGGNGTTGAGGMGGTGALGTGGVTVEVGGTVTGGSGGDGTIGGNGNIGVSSGGSITIDGSVQGGSGGTGSSGKGGEGGKGGNASGSGTIAIGTGGSVNGGNGGTGATTGGNGGDGTASTGGGNVTVGGNTSGGSGGSGATTGGNGGDGAQTSGSGTITSDGTTTGGAGGNGSTGNGGIGGNGAITDTGSINGNNSTGGNGGTSTGAAGGNGGDGSTSTGGGNVTVGGDSSGGSGGNGATTGGTGGDGTTTDGSTEINSGGSATGGNGGTGTTGGGGAGGSGSTSGGNITVDNGSTSGGNGGGSTGAAGGNGGSGSTSGGGNITIDNGSTSGGSGGNGATTGGNGGDGSTTTGTGTVEVSNGSTTGGNGGTGTSGTGGEGGNGAITDNGNITVGKDSETGTTTGGTGGSGATGGSGGSGSTSTGSGSVDINAGSGASGGDGGSGSSGAGGAGGNGTNTNTGDTTVDGGASGGKDGTAEGGAGGSGSTSGGNGGNGSVSTGGGDITVGGGTMGGSGGTSTGAAGGNGGDGSTSSGGGNITVGGDSSGGSGGNGATTGGTGGDGTTTDGSTEINSGGSATGGNGGTGTTGGGGAGGSGSTSGGNITVDNGSTSGGNGGGSTGAAGGNGGSGSTSGGGNITVDNGSTSGGSGGNGATTGGNGGDGSTTTGTGTVDVNNGSTSGGNGGTGTSGTGGEGGNGAITDNGNITVGKDGETGTGTVTGGDGGSGGTTGGAGGSGSTSTGTGSVDINAGSGASGGDGGSGSSGAGGAGGNGTTTNTGDTTVDGSTSGGKDGTTTGGSGGNSTTGGGGNGGSGSTSTGGGDITVGGGTTGGSGGSGKTEGGNGGDGTTTDGNTEINNGGSTSGGTGGTGTTGGGGAGGDGSTSSGGNITVDNGSTSGGSGGNGATTGGNGGDGSTTTGTGTVEVSNGSTTGGNGGTGTSGTGGEGGNGAITDNGNITVGKDGETGTVIGGDGGSGGTTGGAGGSGSTSTGTGSVDINTGSGATGGNGGSGGSGTGGAGGSGTTTNTGDTTVDGGATGGKDGTTAGGSGGNSTTGGGGNGGSGSSSTGGGDITVGGGTTGGTGGSGKTEGGDGGNGTTTDGNTEINGGGSTTGGTGGTGTTGGGGAGGDGSTSSGGNITVDNGSTSGGSGGNGATTGGNGGDGSTTTGTGTVEVSNGSTTGGNGGTGTSGTGGEGGNGAITDNGNITVGDGNTTGTVTGGTGGSGGTIGGAGGSGSTSTGTGSVDINTGSGATGGNGGSGGSGTGGAGGNGTTTNTGDTTVDGSTSGGKDGTIAGGSGGNSTTGGGGNGGSGSSSTGGGDITVGGDTTGGAGGSGSASGGNGGSGSTTGGNTTVNQGGNTSGGDGGNATGGGNNATGSGGAGGNGSTSTGSGSTTVNGGATGGSGGNASGNGNGGNGGAGASQGNGTVGGNGSVTGGNGGNGSGTGDGGTGGAAVGGGASAGMGLTEKPGVNGRKAITEVNDSQAGTKVTMPDQSTLTNAALTEDEKNDTDITEVEVILNVKKENSPTDKDKVDAVLGNITADTIGAFFDITLDKIITKTSIGKQPSEKVENANAEIEITITIPTDMRGGSNYVVIRVHNGAGEALNTVQLGDDLTFKTDKFSTYAIAYTKSVAPPPPPTDNTSGGDRSSNNDEYDFWMTVKDKIQKADSGDVIKVSAKYYDKMPASVMRALYKSGVGMVITWNGGKTITIPAGKAQKAEGNRIYYPLSLLAELYQGIEFVETPAKDPANPKTGGGYIAYADGKQIPITGGVTELAPPAIDSAPDTAMPGAPETITPPTAGFEADTFAGTPDAKAARGMGTAAIAGFAMLLAALCGGGVWFWKRRTQTEKQ